ncbi:MAG: hypothetical protein ACREUE_10820 [Panacagrimonas sp.]
MLAALGLGVASASVTGAAVHEPYERKAAEGLYGLLFCDDPTLFRNALSAEDGTWGVLFATPPDIQALQKIAGDEARESRLRALVFKRLREEGAAVPPKILLGVIVEVPFKDGLDTLAAYADGRVRYLNRSGKVGIFEAGPDEVLALARDLVDESKGLVAKLGPWDKPRLPPPKPGKVRMSFVVSDGLYFGEGPLDVMQQDPLGGPVLAKAALLLQAVVAASTQ